ncbi:hypothetical protein X801_07203, partial [Opisthorchis viverrini]
AADLRGPPKTHWKDLAHRPVTDYSQVVGLVTSNRYLYVATRFGNNSGSKNVIMRIAAESETSLKASGPKMIETPVGSNWIMQDERTVFVGAFEFHNAVYFIFRETAHEALESCQSQLFLRLYETWRHREKNFLQLKTGYCIPNWESVPGESSPINS